MNRKEFLKISALGAAMVAVPGAMGACVGNGGNGEAKKKSEAKLRIAFQESTAPGETLGERLDWMEANGVVGFEPWGARLWERVDEFKGVLSGRNIEMSAICAGFDGFILAEDATVKAAFDDTMRRIIAAAGELGSVGMIMVPAFNGQKPCMPHSLETRAFLVEELAKLGEFALSHGTTVLLEPLNRNEAFYLRQVPDAAAICRDTGSAGVKVIGDFWHMSEETNDYAALHSAGAKWLGHIHIASRGGRVMPGEDGEVDNYLDGFRALKEIGYGGHVSFECGSRGDKTVTVPAALELLRRQWEEA